MRMLGIAVLLVCALSARASPVPFGPGFVRGVCYPSPTAPATEYGTPGCQDMLKAIKAAGATAVSLCPHYLMRRTRPFTLAPYPGAADRDALKKTIEWARAAGLEVHLRPQVLTDAKEPRFHLHIDHRDDWKWMFGSLDTLLRDLGELGRETGVRALSIGTRLDEAVRVTPENWRTLIARVREVFPGLVTYDAEWRREADDVPFWRDLDVISVTVFRRVPDPHDPWDRPRPGRLWRDADRVTDPVSDLWYRFGKPVWISEVGYPNDRLFACLLNWQDRRWLSGVMVWAVTPEKPAWDELKTWFAPGPARSRNYYDQKDLVPWVDDWF
jgi:hypothetical protein